jgi:DNA invertase Pin-like site-specific DNA recombinase
MQQPAVFPRTARRAVGILRVSHVGDRSGESFVSPTDQRASIEAACTRERLELVGIREELDISGGNLLEKRPGLSAALRLIESGGADVMVVAYFDRLFRHLGVQREVLARVEAAGGTVLTVDAGVISTSTASRWLTSTVLGMVAEYHRLITGEKTAAAKSDAVRRGVPPFPLIPPGYRRGADGRLVVEPAEAAAVAEAFQLRADGASIFDVRDVLRQRGIERSYRATQLLLGSRIVLGEIHSGSIVNRNAHEPIVDRALWRKVQDVKLPRGPRAPSERLLARLRVLRCDKCSSLMGATYGYKQRGGPKYAKYVCGMRTECDAPAMISAAMIEAAVKARTKDLLEDISGSASPASNVAVAEAELTQQQALLDAAVAAFDGLDVQSARQRLLDLQDAVRLSADRVARLRAAAGPTRTFPAAGDWDRLTVDEWRGFVRVALREVRVRAGRGPDRVQFFEQ